MGTASDVGEESTHWAQVGEVHDISLRPPTVHVMLYTGNRKCLRISAAWTYHICFILLPQLFVGKFFSPLFTPLSSFAERNLCDSSLRCTHCLHR